MQISQANLWYIIKIIPLFSINFIENKLFIKAVYSHFMDCPSFQCIYKSLNRLFYPRVK